jgi:hypothetical protein
MRCGDHLDAPGAASESDLGFHFRPLVCMHLENWITPDWNNQLATKEHLYIGHEN